LPVSLVSKPMIKKPVRQTGFTEFYFAKLKHEKSDIHFSEM
jgi:hypothetical protein